MEKTIGRKFRVILVAVMTMLLCITLIAFGSYALFSDKREVVGHLKAGTLGIELWRTDLKYNALGADGYEYIGENNERIDFTNDTTRNLFDLNDGSLTAPGCWYEATLQIKNNGTVAFIWWLELTMQGEASDLSEQMQITVTLCDNDGNDLKNADGSLKMQKVSTLKDGTALGSATNPVGHFAITGDNTVATFKVKVEFLNLDNDGSINNAAQADQTTFDLVVNAVQELNNPAATANN